MSQILARTQFTRNSSKQLLRHKECKFREKREKCLQSVKISQLLLFYFVFPFLTFDVTTSKFPLGDEISSVL